MSSDFFSRRMFELVIKSKRLLAPIEPSDYIWKYKVTVCEVSLGDGETGNTVGHFDVWKFLVSVYRDKTRCRLEDMFDADSSEAYQVYRHLFDEAGDVVRGDLEIDTLGSDILYFRSAGFPASMMFSPITLATVERTIEALGGGCSVAVIWPWTKYAAPDADASIKQEYDYLQSQQAHELHWSQIGFKRVQDTPLLIRDLGEGGADIQSLLEMEMTNDCGGP